MIMGIVNVLISCYNSATTIIRRMREGFPESRCTEPRLRVSVVANSAMTNRNVSPQTSTIVRKNVKNSGKKGGER